MRTSIFVAAALVGALCLQVAAQSGGGGGGGAGGGGAGTGGAGTGGSGAVGTGAAGTGATGVDDGAAGAGTTRAGTPGTGATGVDAGAAGAGTTRVEAPGTGATGVRQPGIATETQPDGRRTTISETDGTIRSPVQDTQRRMSERDAARTRPQTDQRQILPGSRIGSDPNSSTGVQPQGTGAGPVGVGTAGADTFGLDFAPAEGGLLISRIAPGSYWPQLGLRHGDLITAVNGIPVTTAAEFQRILANLQPGARLPVVISRDGGRQTIYVVGREQRGFRPFDYDDRGPTPRTRGWLGVYLDARYDQHAVVDGIEVGSTADQVGLRTGDWIVAVNGQRVRSPAHLSQMISTLEPGTRIEVQVSRRDVREMEMTVGNWPTTTRYRYEDASERTGPSGQEGSERTEPSGQEGAESRSETESDTPQQNREGEGSENNP